MKIDTSKIVDSEESQLRIRFKYLALCSKLLCLDAMDSIDPGDKDDVFAAGEGAMESAAEAQRKRHPAIAPDHAAVCAVSWSGRASVY